MWGWGLAAHAGGRTGPENALPAQGGAYVISDVIVREQGDLVAFCQSHRYTLVLA